MPTNLSTWFQNLPTLGLYSNGTWKTLIDQATDIEASLGVYHYTIQHPTLEQLSSTIVELEGPNSTWQSTAYEERRQYLLAWIKAIKKNQKIGSILWSLGTNIPISTATVLLEQHLTWAEQWLCLVASYPWQATKMVERWLGLSVEETSQSWQVWQQLLAAFLAGQSVVLEVVDKQVCFWAYILECWLVEAPSLPLCCYSRPSTLATYLNLIPDKERLYLPVDTYWQSAGKLLQVVVEGADLWAAAKATVLAAWCQPFGAHYTGLQVLVQEAVAPTFHAYLASFFSQLRLGEALDPSVDVVLSTKSNAEQATLVDGLREEDVTVLTHPELATYPNAPAYVTALAPTSSLVPLQDLQGIMSTTLFRTIEEGVSFVAKFKAKQVSVWTQQHSLALQLSQAISAELVLLNTIKNNEVTLIAPKATSLAILDAYQQTKVLAPVRLEQKVSLQALGIKEKQAAVPSLAAYVAGQLQLGEVDAKLIDAAQNIKAKLSISQQADLTKAVATTQQSAKWLRYTALERQLSVQQLLDALQEQVALATDSIEAQQTIWKTALSRVRNLIAAFQQWSPTAGQQGSIYWQQLPQPLGLVILRIEADLDVLAFLQTLTALLLGGNQVLVVAQAAQAWALDMLVKALQYSILPMDACQVCFVAPNFNFTHKAVQQTILPNSMADEHRLLASVTKLKTLVWA